MNDELWYLWETCAGVRKIGEFDDFLKSVRDSIDEEDLFYLLNDCYGDEEWTLPIIGKVTPEEALTKLRPDLLDQCLEEERDARVDEVIYELDGTVEPFETYHFYNITLYTIPKTIADTETAKFKEIMDKFLSE